MQEKRPIWRARYHIGMLAALALSPCLGQELPPEIQIDRLLVQAERETGDGEHWSAAITLERIPGTVRGARLGDSLDFVVPSGWGVTGCGIA